MPRQEGLRVRRRTRRTVNPFVLIVAAAAVFSALVAGIWQLQSRPAAEPLEPVIDPALLSGPIVTQSSSQTPSSSEPGLPAAEPLDPDGTSFDESSSTSEAQSESSETAMAVSSALGEQERVTSAYFDDAAFVGDSITTGIKLYEVMQNADVFASTGLGLGNILTQEVVRDGDQTLTILQALEQAQPGKIYIMLGANSLGSSNEWALEKYGELVDAIKAQHPNSLIYIQSVLPIYEPTFNVRYGKDITNASIASFNESLCAMAAEKGVYYLDVASVFRDETGAMPEQYTPDGIHINSAQYIMWFDYLKTHAIMR